MQLTLPSPIQRIEHPLPASMGVELWMKRDDLIHPEISGNKYRKLQHNLAQAKVLQLKTVLTFGGAYSNHIAATAAACHALGLNSIGIVRGEDADLLNHTLKQAAAFGMQIIPVSRSTYDRHDDKLYHEELHEQFPETYIVPQGGANYFGVQGCVEILGECPIEPDLICVAVGTGTTLAGLSIASKEHQEIWGFPAIKDGAYLKEEIRKLVYWSLMDESWTSEIMNRIHLQTDYHFGGFGKTSPELKQFVEQFQSQTGIPLDYLYTGKMMYGIWDLLRKEKLRNKKILVIHTGGLQGNASL
jgi:1-aminocyclopropane-1-carboxylate deaminase